jgi:thiamine biosynthesis lipoprotein
MVAELHFRAMGSDAHVIVVGGSADLIERARRRVDELEQRWSRFLPGSEISRLNRRAGTAVLVSAETIQLVEHGIAAWRISGGAVDPTVLGDVVRAGYDRTFEAIGPTPAGRFPERRPFSLLGIGCDHIEVSDGRVRLPSGTGFDPGGIGKGLAADLVAAETMAAGADGVCVNLGGDLRVIGTGPAGGGWTVAVEHPWSAGPLALVGIGDGAAATSTTLRRRWETDGVTRHHLIDPATGLPSGTDVNLATAVSGQAWMAEVMAKAVLLRGSQHPFDLIDGTGSEAVIVRTDGRVTASAGFAAYLGGATLPADIAAPTSADQVGGMTKDLPSRL